MSFGTIYTHNPSPRVFAILALAKAHNLPLEIIQADRTDGPNYEKLLTINPLGQVPTFVGADGFVLTECIPITLYITSHCQPSLIPEPTTQKYHHLLQWLSFSNSQLLPNIGGIILPLIGRPQRVKMDKGDCLREFYGDCGRLERHFSSTSSSSSSCFVAGNNEDEREYRYLLGQDISVADYFTVGCMLFAVKIFHDGLLEKFPRMMEWWRRVYEDEVLKGLLGDFEVLRLEGPLPELKGEGEVV